MELTCSSMESVIIGSGPEAVPWFQRLREIVLLNLRGRGGDSSAARWPRGQRRRAAACFVYADDRALGFLWRSGLPQVCRRGATGGGAGRILRRPLLESLAYAAIRRLSGALSSDG